MITLHRRVASVGAARVLLASGLVFGLGAWWWFAAPPRASARPNVLIVTIDTLRADHVGAYGASFARTPAMDRLAAEGVRCADAIASAPITMPSHASLLTGLFPPSHGVRDNGTAALPKDVVTLTERLGTAGYTNHAFVSAVVLSRLYGLDAGFDTYDDDLWSEDAPRLFMIRERPARRTTDRVLEWLGTWTREQAAAAQTGAQKPFFAWVHYFDPHQPLEAAPEDRAGAASPYDAEVTAADRGLGRIIDALRNAPATTNGAAGNLLDNTIVIVTSDHGESLGEHGEETHAVFVYDATVRVPLIVRYPARFAAGRVYDGPVRHVDVMPTVLSLLGLPGEPGTQGVDLTAAWQGSAPAPALAQYSESLLSELGFGMAPLYALRKDGFKWIRAPRPELYDLRNDPRELTNLLEPATTTARAAAAATDAAKAKGIASELDAELEQVLTAGGPGAKSAQAGDGAQAESPMSRETVEMLQSLGYLAPSSMRRGMAGIDPKDGIVVYRQLEEARHEAQRRRWPEAETIVRTILDTVPNHVAARNVLGLSLVRQRKYAEARQAYTQSLASDPNQFRIHANLGSLSMLERDLKGAEGGFTRALELNPRFIEAMLNLGLIASLRGDNAAAERWYRQADAVDPGFPGTARRMGDLYYEQGRFREALAQYDRALQLAPRMFPALVQAGNSARRVGDATRAAESFQRAATLRPDSWVPWYNLACLRATRGDVDGAWQALRESLRRGPGDPALLHSDPDLAALRADPRFDEIVRQHK